MVTHISEELAQSAERVTITTKYGPVTGARTQNGAIAFLEIPYGLPPRRFDNPEPLPSSFKYEDKEYIREVSYAVQPGNDGQAAGIPVTDKLGFGKPTENPLFVNIVIPPSFDSSSSLRYPVKVYIHGGFLQFGSPHSLSSQAQYVAAARNEVRVNIGYRLSVFGFLACDTPCIEGNFGFKDQWLALEWVKDNISSFGGDDQNIEVAGLSAGAHSVHQILHHASRLPPTGKAPFQRAVLYSNAILHTPKTPENLREQFETLCRALNLNPASPDILEILRDPVKTPSHSLISAIEEGKLGPLGTFRGCLDGDWLAKYPDPLSWQRSSGFSDGLKRAGVRSIVIGDLSEEWYLYSIAHPIDSRQDIETNLLRYYPEEIVNGFLAHYPRLDENASPEECTKRFGEVLSAGQVHLPVRLLARDLIQNSFPVLRYEIRWTPERSRILSKGYVTHGTDMVIWSYRLPSLKEDEILIAKTWLIEVNRERDALEQAGKSTKSAKQILALREDREIEWEEDNKFDHIMRLEKVVSE